MGKPDRHSGSLNAVFISHDLCIKAPPPLEFKMPFFEKTQEFTINGGVFNEIYGDRNNFDYSCHVQNDNSYNNNTTTTIGSHNDSSIRLNAASTQQISLTGGSHPIEARKKEMDIADQAAMLLQLEHALGRRPIPLSRTNLLLDSAAMVREVKTYQADNPFTKMSPPRQPLRQNSDPSPISSNPNIPRHKSNNPFKSLLMRSDVDLLARSSSQNKNMDDMNVDSDKP